jgi:hypothetical protein
MADEKQPETGFNLPAGVITSRKEQRRVRTDRFQSVYANNTAVSFSTYDVSLLFGEIIGEAEGQSVIEEVLKVNMSRELAKALTVILVQHLKIWEEQFGEIKIPDLALLSPEPNDVADLSGEIPLAT